MNKITILEANPLGNFLEKLKKSGDIFSSSLVHFNVGGRPLEIPLSCLLKFPSTHLSEIISGKPIPNHLKDTIWRTGDHGKGSTFFINTEYASFSTMLDGFRIGCFHPSSTICCELFAEQLKMWGVPENTVAACCASSFFSSLSTSRSFSGIKASFQPPAESPHKSGCRTRLWRFIEYPSTSRAATAFAIISLLITTISLIATAIGTLPVFRELKDDINTTASVPNRSQWPLKNQRYDFYSTQMIPELYWLHAGCIVFFNIELILRIVAQPRLRGILRSFDVWLDILTVIPTNLFAVAELAAFFMTNVSNSLTNTKTAFQILASIRALRVIQAYKIYEGLFVLLLALKASLKEAMLMLVLVLVASIVFGNLLFFFESKNDKSYFKSVPHSCWCAVVTMTTVGYGDMYPITWHGRLIATLCAVFGMLIIVMPVPIIANNFNLYYIHFQGRRMIQKRKTQ